MYYVAVIGGKDLVANSFVSWRNEDRQEGFNRVLSEPRARDIAKYLETANQ